jgi:hypothetical protein
MLSILNTLSEITLELGIAAAVVLVCYLIVKFTAPKKEEDPKKDPDYEDMTIVYFMVKRLQEGSIPQDREKVRCFLHNNYVKLRTEFNVETNQRTYVVPNRHKLYEAVIREYCKE